MVSPARQPFRLSISEVGILPVVVVAPQISLLQPVHGLGTAVAQYSGSDAPTVPFHSKQALDAIGFATYKRPPLIEFRRFPTFLLGLLAP